MLEHLNRIKKIKREELAAREAPAAPAATEVLDVPESENAAQSHSEPAIDAPMQRTPEPVPEPTAELPEKKAEPEVHMSRRGFLRGMGGAMAATALSSIPQFLQTELAEARTIEGAPGARIREAKIDEIVATHRRAFSAPEVRNALMGRTDKPVSTLLRALQAPILASDIEGTKYDSSMERKRYCMQLAFQRTPSGENSVSVIPASLPKDKYATDDKFGYGNFAYFGRPDRGITAQHVSDEMHGRADSMAAPDLTVLGLPPSMKVPMDRVIQDDTSLSNIDINGSLVTVEGVDPDASSTDGCKTYPAVAVKLTREWVDQVFVPTSNDPEKLRKNRQWRERLARSFMIVLPPGEATGDIPEKRPGAGMSGSPVFMHRNGQRVFCGVFHAVHPMRDPTTGRTVDVGFFHGIEEVRERVGSQIRSGA